MKTNNKRDKMSKNEKGKHRGWLTSHGCASSKAKEVMKEEENNAAAEDILASLITYVGTLPRA